MRVILHIGTNKTGTSALQRVLSQNPKPLREAGLIYPEYGQRSPDLPGHHRIPEQLTRAPHHADYVVSHLEEEVANAQAEGAFLSSEVFHISNPHAFVDTLRERDHEVEAICVVRNHIDYFSSWYRETVKSEISTFDFPNFAYLIRNPYMPFLSLWDTVLGSENFHVYKYENHRFFSGRNSHPVFDSIISDQQVSQEMVSENVSLTGNLLFFKRLLNNFINRDTAAVLLPEMYQIAEIEPRFIGDMFIASDLCGVLDTVYAQDTHMINEYFGVDISSHNSYRQGSQVPDFSTLSDDRKLILDICDKNGFLFGDLLRKFTGEM